MPKTVNAKEAGTTLDSLVGWVVDNQDEVIVETEGKAQAVIISFDAYEQVRALKEQQRRQAALEELRQLRDEVRSRNTDIQTDEEAMALADRFVRDVIDDMVAEGKIKFEKTP
jgi:PHD/YefM family antitoxin component YafN of YafNO toxin-antitoxin module